MEHYAFPKENWHDNNAPKYMVGSPTNAALISPKTHAIHLPIYCRIYEYETYPFIGQLAA